MKTGLMLLALMMLCPSGGIWANERPQMLDIAVGGFDGPSYSVTLTNGVLAYRSGGSMSLLLETKPEIVSPTDSEWRAFRTSRDQIGAWNWKTNYVDPNVLDGTEWHVIVKYGSKAVESEGANAYPHGKGADPGPAFKKLLTAVSKLLSEREFKCWSNLRPEGTH